MADESLKGGELIIYVTYITAIRKTASDIARLQLIFDNHKIPYTKIDLGVNPEKREDMVKRSGQKTLPQVFIDETYIGVPYFQTNNNNSSKFTHVFRDWMKLKTGMKMSVCWRHCVKLVSQEKSQAKNKHQPLQTPLQHERSLCDDATPTTTPCPEKISIIIITTATSTTSTATTCSVSDTFSTTLFT